LQLIRASRFDEINRFPYRGREDLRSRQSGRIDVDGRLNGRFQTK
jgi:hypothetical protein